MDGKVSMVFNHNCFPKMDLLFKLRRPTGSHVHCKPFGCGREMAQDRHVVTHTTNRRYRMAYLFVPFPMTLDDLEGHSRNARLIKCNSTTIFSTVLTDTSRRAVPRRQLSFLSCLARAYMLQTYDLTDVV